MVRTVIELKLGNSDKKKIKVGDLDVLLFKHNKIFGDSNTTKKYRIYPSFMFGGSL